MGVVSITSTCMSKLLCWNLEVGLPLPVTNTGKCKTLLIVPYVIQKITEKVLYFQMEDSLFAINLCLPLVKCLNSGPMGQH